MRKVGNVYLRIYDMIFMIGVIPSHPRVPSPHCQCNFYLDGIQHAFQKDITYFIHNRDYQNCLKIKFEPEGIPFGTHRKAM